MRLYYCFLLVTLGLASSVPSLAAEEPGRGQSNQNQNQTKKVWTNEDMGQLRARGLISIFVSSSAQTAIPPAPQQSSALPRYNSRLEDPQWYSLMSADLQSELDKRRAALREQQVALALAPRGITQPGIAMDRPALGVTPEAALENLQAQVDEIQNQLDELGDLARMYSIPPGVLRG